MRTLLVLLTLTLSFNAFAKPRPRDLPPVNDESLNRGDEFLVEKFDAAHGVYRVVFRNDESIELFATLKDLAAGVKAINADRVYLAAHPEALEKHKAVVDRADEMRVLVKEEAEKLKPLKNEDTP